MDQLNNQPLHQVAQALVSGGKGLLAMDESIPTCNARLRENGIPETALYRQKYRELIVTTSGLEEFISGAILSDETLTSSAAGSKPFAEMLTSRGIMAGIKVDQGTVPMAGVPGEKVTEGLDGLAVRLQNYRRYGVRFAKWRSVTHISTGSPSSAALHFNAQLLARYAAICQEASLVPIVEPEVLMTGAHSLELCHQVTRQFLFELFNALYEHRVDLRAILLKPNMVLPGTDSPDQSSDDEIALATLACLLDRVPAAVPGIVFLSGGQAAKAATKRLNALNQEGQLKGPWKLSFSFSRAILQPVLAYWKGQDQYLPGAQQILLHRSGCNSAACLGNYHPEEDIAP
ncbi:class I fructose-bisphosphate aldolase [Mucilaginibacter aquariorum]|uniref:fructose-bisphosphate aldolase n=1 Tax=Mucilaginibacter aquariorum TaxID=2967225 RepID=A0ABT1T2V0_9SPHI|nr:class I fructose-bisphosphate aldolase [Mucilaginibacter aquariorum]MCQ6958745.1 fructose-bisphosphate aldolase class I [Mucilaginibacter aquariorum]